MSLWGTILNELDSARSGAAPSWLALVIVLPFAGHAVAWAWGPRAHLAAQRALLLVGIDWGLSLVLAWPVHQVPLLLGLLPLVGAALPRRQPRFSGDPLAWFVACLMAVIPITLNHFDPFVWSTVWFVILITAAGARGILEPAWARIDGFRAHFRRAENAENPPAVSAGDAPGTIK